jgi:anti-anti-sigma factor
VPSAAIKYDPLEVKPFSIDIARDHGEAHVRLVGELDIATTPGAEAEVKRLEQDGARVIVLDLRGLTFMDSTGLRLLVAADARAREMGRQLTIIKGPEAVHRVLEITGLDAKLNVVAAPDEAGASG